MGQIIPNMPGGAGTNRQVGSNNGMYGGGPGYMWDPQQSYQFGEQQKQGRELAGLQSQTELARSQMAADASTLPARLQQQRFNSVFPWLQGQYSNLANQQVGGASGQGGGMGPAINVSPVWNEQQIQGQVNAQAAKADQSAATQARTANASLAGRGFGANSPLAMALQGQYQNQALASKVGNEQSIRWNAAQGNATQVLNAQQAQAQEYAQRQQEGLASQKMYFDRQNALIAALGGLI